MYVQPPQPHVNSVGISVTPSCDRLLNCYVKFADITELRACETLWSAREIASVALSAERERRTENVFHMLLRGIYKVKYQLRETIFFNLLRYGGKRLILFFFNFNQRN